MSRDRRRLHELLGEQSSQLGQLRNQHIVRPCEYLGINPASVVVEHIPVQPPPDHEVALPRNVLAGAGACVLESGSDSDTPGESLPTDAEGWSGGGPNGKQTSADDRDELREASRIKRHLVALEQVLVERQLRRRSSMALGRAASRAAGRHQGDEVRDDDPTPAGIINAGEEEILSRIVSIVASNSQPLFFSSNMQLERHHIGAAWLLWKQLLLAEEQSIVAGDAERQVSTILVRRLRELDPYFFDMVFSATDLQLHGRSLLNAVTYAIQNVGNEEKFARRFEQLGVRHCSFGVTPDKLSALSDALCITLEDIRDRVWWPDNHIRTLKEIMHQVVAAMRRGAASEAGVDAILAFEAKRSEEVFQLMAELITLDNADVQGFPETFMGCVVAAATGNATRQEEELARGNMESDNQPSSSDCATPVLLCEACVERIRPLAVSQAFRPMIRLLKQLQKLRSDTGKCDKLLFDLGVRHKRFPGVTPAALLFGEKPFVTAARDLYTRRRRELTWRKEMLLTFWYRRTVSTMIEGLRSTFEPPDSDEE